MKKDETEKKKMKQKSGKTGKIRGCKEVQNRKQAHRNAPAKIVVNNGGRWAERKMYKMRSVRK